MTWEKIRPWFKFRLDGEEIQVTGDLVQNESLVQMTQVVQIELFDQPELRKNQTMTVDYVELATDLMSRQFAGTLNHVNTLSFPHAVTLTGAGVLIDLDRAPNGDINLTGMTDGEAWMTVLDECEIAYDPDDIFDCGYVLGDKIDVIWSKDQSGWSIGKELDLVFGTATIEIGDARVVRFPYSLVPVAADIYRTFTNGIDADFFTHERDLWDRSQIQNKFHVTGATWEGVGEADTCRYTPWARASAANDDFPTGSYRVKTEPFRSDFIQDEALASAVATRLMQWHNRQPDRLGINTKNDVNLCPGRTIGVESAVYGIDLLAAAAISPYVITAVDRRGAQIILTCVGGIAGEVGTITTGVERVCNKAISDINVPGVFAPPAIFGPPLSPLSPLSPYTLEPLPCEAGSFTIGAEIPISCDWTISGTVRLGLKTQRLKIGILTEAEQWFLTIAGPDYYAALNIPAKIWELNANGQYKQRWGHNVMHAPIDYELQWDWVAKKLRLSVATFAGVSYSASMTFVVADEYGSGITLRELTGTPARSNEILCVSEPHEGGAEDPNNLISVDNIVNWQELGPTLSTGTGTLVLTQNGSAYYPVAVNLSENWVLTATVIMQSALSSHDFMIGLGNAGGSVHYGINVLNTSDPFAYIYAFGANDWLDGSAFSDDDPLDIILTWNAATDVLYISISDGPRTETTSIAANGSPGFNVYPVIWTAGTNGEGGIEVTAITMVVG